MSSNSSNVTGDEKLGSLGLGKLKDSLSPLFIGILVRLVDWFSARCSLRWFLSGSNWDNPIVRDGSNTE